MNVNEVIDICKKILDLDTDGDISSTENFKEDDAAVRLLTCCNFVSEELYRDYGADCRKTVIEVKDGRADLNGLKLCRVINLADADGNPVHYRYAENALAVERDGKYNLSYAKLPKELGFGDDLTLPSPRITERIFIYGVLAEFLSQQEDRRKSASWRKKYVDALSVATAKFNPTRMPSRRWL
ncbi:MAG: hypothetical protein NC332_02890 [Firmicutes bacterium]|nr:hypothetical protein [Bacillota bacterium]